MGVFDKKRLPLNPHRIIIFIHIIDSVRPHPSESALLLSSGIENQF
jgi:hypothetical protein